VRLETLRPLIDTNAVAAALFWPVFVAWGVMEWGQSAAERRRFRLAGKGRSAEDRGTAGLFFVAIYAGFALAFVAAYTATWAAIPGPRWLWFGVGMTFIVAGNIVRQWSVHTLGPLFTREVRVQEGHTLVTAGPYRIVRHPSYAAGLVADAGVGFALGNWLSIVAVTGCIFAAMVRRISVEEDALRNGLGPGEYERYAAGRARLLPGVW
jgi:protein-S-isoprenylcysteine O-methyltransferase